MPEETPQLPVSPQETQIQAPSFLEKIQAQKKKILIGLGSFLGILILAGVIFGVYKYAQNQIPLEPTPAGGPTPLPSEAPAKEGDPTADWQTYTNTEYGYSIKYPQEFEKRESVSLEQGTLAEVVFSFLGPTQAASGRLETELFDGLSVRVSVRDETPKNLDEYAQNLRDKDTQATLDLTPEGTVSQLEKITVAQKQGWTYTVEGYGNAKVILLPGKNIIQITAGYAGSEGMVRGYLRTFDLMLSTFKFLEEGTLPSVTPSDKVINYEYIEGWPFYSASGMGFTFQYPPSYSSPKKAIADPGAEGEPYCEFLSTRKPQGAQNVESIRVLVVSYTGGSRRELLMKRLALFEKDILSVQEIEFAPVTGLLIEFKPQYPIWEKYFTSILIQGSTALIIGNLQIDLNEDEWDNLLKSFQIKDFHLDLSKCESDWD